MNLPEFVYLIWTAAEWPVDAVAGDHPLTAQWVAERVQKRVASPNVINAADVRVWRVRVTEPVEMELTPETVTPPSLREVSP